MNTVSTWLNWKKKKKKKHITELALTCVYVSAAFIDIALLGVFAPPPLKVDLDSLDRQVKDIKRDKGRAEDSVTKPCRETARLRDMQCKQGKPEHRAGGCR